MNRCIWLCKILH